MFTHYISVAYTKAVTWVHLLFWRIKGLQNPHWSKSQQFPRKYFHICMGHASISLFKIKPPFCKIINSRLLPYRPVLSFLLNTLIYVSEKHSSLWSVLRYPTARIQAVASIEGVLCVGSTGTVLDSFYNFIGGFLKSERSNEKTLLNSLVSRPKSWYAFS